MPLLKSGVLDALGDHLLNDDVVLHLLRKVGCIISKQNVETEHHRNSQKESFKTFKVLRSGTGNLNEDSQGTRHSSWILGRFLRAFGAICEKVCGQIPWLWWLFSTFIGNLGPNQVG